MAGELVFEKSPRFEKYVRFLAREKVIELRDGGRPRIVDPRTFSAIGLGLFTHFVATGLNRGRRVTYLALPDDRTAVLVEASTGKGMFLTGPSRSAFATSAVGDGMTPRRGLCAGDSLVRVNWSIFGSTNLPRSMPQCDGCVPACATAEWTAKRLARRPTDAPALTGGHALILNAKGAFFEAAFSEPIDPTDEAEPDTDRQSAAKLLNMELFDAFVTIDLAARAEASVYMPNSYLSRPIRSSYELDSVVYEPDKRVVVVETALGTADELEEIVEDLGEGDRRPSEEGRVARRLKRKFISHGVFSLHGVKKYRYVYATVQSLPADAQADRDTKYMRYLFEKDKRMRLVELDALEPEIKQLNDTGWWDAAVMRSGYRKFRREIAKAAGLG